MGTTNSKRTIMHTHTRRQIDNANGVYLQKHRRQLESKRPFSLCLRISMLIARCNVCQWFSFHCFRSALDFLNRNLCENKKWRNLASFNVRQWFLEIFIAKKKNWVKYSKYPYVLVQISHPILLQNLVGFIIELNKKLKLRGKVLFTLKCDK